MMIGVTAFLVGSSSEESEGVIGDNEDDLLLSTPSDCDSKMEQSNFGNKESMPVIDCLYL